MYKRRITHDILQRFLEGNCSEDEKSLVEDWYAQLDRHFDDNSNSVPSFDKENVFDKIKSELGIADYNEPKLSRSTKSLKYYLAIAASVIVIVFAGYSVFFNDITKGKSADKSIADKLPENTLLNSNVFTNTSGLIVKEILPDGSTVWLNPGAVLKYTKSPGSANRNIDFSGEAFFEVARDVTAPFVIHTGSMTTTVLGTSFNVRAIPHSTKFKVSVVSGSVNVSVNDAKKVVQSVLLKPNEQANFHLSTRELTFTPISIIELKENFWKPVSLNFEDADMSQIADELEKAFKIKVEFEKPGILKCKLKVDFENQKLPQILEFLEKLLDVQCKLNDQNVLMINGEGCN